MTAQRKPPSPMLKELTLKPVTRDVLIDALTLGTPDQKQAFRHLNKVYYACCHVFTDASADPRNHTSYGIFELEVTHDPASMSLGLPPEKRLRNIVSGTDAAEVASEFLRWHSR